MPPGPWIPPASERAVGLDFYATGSPPLPARIKAGADDFVVREISEYPLPDRDGAFTVLRVRSRDWEQHELAQRLAGRLRLPPHAIAWAGTKDRRAVSERLFSYRGPPPVAPIDLHDATVLEAYRARDGLSLGHHYGNAFAVRLTTPGTDPRTVAPQLEATRRELRELGAFPNLFGLQRFGEIRPVTHLVGRALVRGSPSEAVDLYLTWIGDAPDGLGVEARRAYSEHHDPERALREFPQTFGFERRLLDHLSRGHPPERAIGALSKELRTLFVHAYQSLLFNRWLARRDAAGLSWTVPETGDWLLRVLRNGTIGSQDPIPVGSDNLSECREFARKGQGSIAGPLVGFETPPLSGTGGELYESILREEGVERRDWRMPKSPELSSRGAWRPISVATPPIAVTTEPDREASAGGAALWLRFALPKGSYATILLREFLKNGATASTVASKQSF